MFKIMIFLICCVTTVSALTITGGEWNTVNIDNGDNGFVYSTAISYSHNYGTWGVETIVTFTPEENETIEILGIALGGDIGGSSSTTVFKIYGGDLDFQFYAGSTSYSNGSDLYLGKVNGYFLYQIGGVAALTANQGETVYIQNLLNIDPDGYEIGQYGSVTDIYGNTFNDNSYNSSRRIWINYRIVTNVPEPSSMILFAVSILSLICVYRKK